MQPRALVHRAELILHEGGGWVLIAFALMRLASGLAIEHVRWLLDSQVLACCLLLALLQLCGTVFDRRTGYVASGVLGTAAWAAALTLIPRYGWPRWHAGPWLIGGALALLVLCVLYRLARRRRWLAILSGHGYEWILSWAEERPLYARILARRVLKSLGYRGER